MAVLSSRTSVSFDISEQVNTAQRVLETITKYIFFTDDLFEDITEALDVIENVFADFQFENYEIIPIQSGSRDEICFECALLVNDQGEIESFKVSFGVERV